MAVGANNFVMKKLFFILVMVPASFLASQSLNDITRAISSGDATALGQYFDQSVEVGVLDKEDVYSKTEAITIVKDFFTRYKPQSFSQMHQGENESNSQYCIGNMVTSGGSFRVYIYLNKTGDKLLIQEIRFDPE